MNQPQSSPEHSSENEGTKRRRNAISTLLGTMGAVGAISFMLSTEGDQNAVKAGLEQNLKADVMQVESKSPINPRSHTASHSLQRGPGLLQQAAEAQYANGYVGLSSSEISEKINHFVSDVLGAWQENEDNRDLNILQADLSNAAENNYYTIEHWQTLQDYFDRGDYSQMRAYLNSLKPHRDAVLLAKLLEDEGYDVSHARELLTAGNLAEANAELEGIRARSADIDWLLSYCSQAVDRVPAAQREAFSNEFKRIAGLPLDQQPDALDNFLRVLKDSGVDLSGIEVN